MRIDRLKRLRTVMAGILSVFVIVAMFGWPAESARKGSERGARTAQTTGKKKRQKRKGRKPRRNAKRKKTGKRAAKRKKTARRSKKGRARKSEKSRKKRSADRAAAPKRPTDNRKVFDIRGQKRTLRMTLMLKNKKDSIRFVRIRKDYDEEIRATNY